MSDRPFKVLGIQQIAVGGLDKNRLRTLWVDTLGLKLTGNFQSESENVDEDIATLGSGPLKVEVDLMQPLDPDRRLTGGSGMATGSGYAFRTRRYPQGSIRLRHLFRPSQGQSRVSHWRGRCVDRTGPGATGSV